MRPIDPRTRDILVKDPLMAKCLMCASRHVQWHHQLLFGRQQVGTWWSILPLCPDHHARANQKKVREFLDWVMVNRAPSDQLRAYSKVRDLVVLKRALNKKFGPWQRSAS